jgi:hypothetical protein
MITGKILDKALELRKKNGLVATKEALMTDLEAAGAKYTVTETPRYRAAGESPIYISGKYLTAKGGICPATGEREEPKDTLKVARKTPNLLGQPAVSEISEDACVRVLAGKGFKFIRLVNSLTGEVVKEETDPRITKLNLVYSAIPKNAASDRLYVTQTSPQVQVSMTLDRFLELAGIKP